MQQRLRTSDDGFGLVELLIAMTMLSVGILALVAAFNSSALALRRADQASTAAVLADKQMELLRSIKNEELELDATLVMDADTTYTDGAPTGEPITTPACTPLEDYCTPTRTIAGADSPNGRSYRLDTYIVKPDVNAQVKVVRITVRDGDDPSHVLVRQESTFHPSTGQ